MIPELPSPWRTLLGEETARPYFQELDAFLDAEALRHEVLPPPNLIFRALELTPPRGLKAVILGQDPYPTPGHAEGLCFSVAPEVKPPVSLRNIFVELASDVDCPLPSHGHLAGWARQGVLLLNTVLTVRAGEAGSHQGRGWERFTDSVIRAVARKRNRVAFILWGAHAQAKRSLIDDTRHAVVTGAHPSYFSAKRGFFGSRPFSTANGVLEEAGREPIDWCRLPLG